MTNRSKEHIIDDLFSQAVESKKLSLNEHNTVASSLHDDLEEKQYEKNDVIENFRLTIRDEDDKVDSLDDEDNIPTLESMVIMDDNDTNFELQTQPLPTLTELDSKINHIWKKSRDGVDLSILMKHLIPKDQVIAEGDDIWTNDFLLKEISPHFKRVYSSNSNQQK